VYITDNSTFSPRGVVERDLTCHCLASQQTSSDAESIPRSHERTAGDRPSAPQAGSPPEIIHFNLVLSTKSNLTLNINLLLKHQMQQCSRADDIIQYRYIQANEP